MVGYQDTKGCLHAAAKATIGVLTGTYDNGFNARLSFSRKISACVFPAVYCSLVYIMVFMPLGIHPGDFS